MIPVAAVTPCFVRVTSSIEWSRVLLMNALPLPVGNDSVLSGAAFT